MSIQQEYEELCCDHNILNVLPATQVQQSDDNTRSFLGVTRHRSSTGDTQTCQKKLQHWTHVMARYESAALDYMS